MKRLVITLVAVLIAGAPLAQGNGASDEARVTLRYEMLRLINKDRAAHGLTPVALDPEASAIADSYCINQIRNGTTGHFTTDGQAPYMRYSFSGGNDGVSENAAAWSGSYTFSDRAVYDMARKSQETMMAERAPKDGHRRTILDPYATHVGIGLAWEKGEFRMAQEFVRRYVTWSRPLPRNAGLTESVFASGKPLPGHRVEAISVHFEPAPQPMPAHVANAIDNYRLPQKRRDYLPRLRSYIKPRPDGTFHLVKEEYRAGGRGHFTVTSDGSFHFEVPFRDGEGVYTVVVWIAKKGDATPIAASNVSIRVSATSSSFAAGMSSASR